MLAHGRFGATGDFVSDGMLIPFEDNFRTEITTNIMTIRPRRCKKGTVAASRLKNAYVGRLEEAECKRSVCNETVWKAINQPL